MLMHKIWDGKLSENFFDIYCINMWAEKIRRGKDALFTYNRVGLVRILKSFALEPYDEFLYNFQFDIYLYVWSVMKWILS